MKKLTILLLTVQGILSNSSAQSNYIHAPDTVYKFIIEPDTEYNVGLNNKDTLATVVVRYIDNPDSEAAIFILYGPSSSVDFDYSTAADRPTWMNYGSGKAIFNLTHKESSKVAQEYKWKVCFIGGLVGAYWSPTIRYFSTIGEPRVVQQPPDVTKVQEGGNVSLRIRAVGGDLKFQWQRKCDYKFEDIDGQVSDALNLPIVTSKDACYYKCVVENSYGEAVSTATYISIEESPKSKK